MEHGKDLGASIVLIDGEHYPPVNKRAIEALRDRGEEPVLALLIGGSEKLGQVPFELDVPLEHASDPEADLAAALDRTGAKRVIDLSDDPVIGYVERCRLASITLWKGAEYVGPDFAFTPPAREAKPAVPSVAVIGTGKRSGKTAITGAAARAYKSAGLDPVVVAMGRGGPPEPEVLDGETFDPASLLQFAKQGRHAASDYIETALVAKVPTVGAWRAGGGLAGAPGFSNYKEALGRSMTLSPGLLILDGSGASIPPASFDACIFALDAGIDPGHLCGYFGLYRLLLADLVVLTMVEEGLDRSHLSAVEDCIRKSLNETRIIRTVFRPYPLGDLSNKKVWFATTAGKEAGGLLKKHLEKVHHAEVVGMSHSLADRESLRADLDSATDADVLAVEIKAAAVDVVARFGTEKGIDLVYIDNRPEPVDPDEDLDGAWLEIADRAGQRHST